MPFSMMGSDRRHLLQPRHSRQAYNAALARALEERRQAATELAKRNVMLEKMTRELNTPLWKQAIRKVKQAFQRKVGLWFVLPLFLCSSADAAVVHDCRIRAIRTKVVYSLSTNVYRFKVYYVGYSGQPLQQRLCPDQNPPVSGLFEVLEDGFENPVDTYPIPAGPGVEESFVSQVDLLPSGHYVFRTFTFQGWTSRDARDIYGEKKFLVR